jgi:hypothetical protein
MMATMSRRIVLLSLALLAVLSLVVVAGLGVFSPAPAPQAVAPPPAKTSVTSEAPVADPPSPQVRTEVVTLRRGDTLVGVLGRVGVDRRSSHDIASALRSGGADLRRLRPSDELEVTWTLEGEPIAVRWEPSPWLGFAVVAADGGWEVRRAETRPDVRVEAVGGEVTRSLF